FKAAAVPGLRHRRHPALAWTHHLGALLMTYLRQIRRPYLRAAFGALAIALLSVFAAQPAPAAGAEQPETVCIQCHGSLPDKLGAPVKLWRTSIHAENG